MPLGRLGEGQSPFPYALTYPQDAHERLLIDRLSALGLKVERRTELVRFDQHAGSVQAVLKRPDGVGGSLRSGLPRRLRRRAFDRPRGVGDGLSWGNLHRLVLRRRRGRQLARRQTARSTSNSKRPISWRSSPSRGRAGCAWSVQSVGSRTANTAS